MYIIADTTELDEMNICFLYLSLFPFTVCSEEFRKCYRYYHGSLQTHDYCASTDNPIQQPVRIQNKLENDFVIYHLSHGVKASLNNLQLHIGKHYNTHYMCTMNIFKQKRVKMP